MREHIVKAEEGFDFLCFRFVRQYSQWRNKRVTRWFPSPKSEMKMRERILALTGNNALALTTPEEAKETLISVRRGWGNYFAHSLASEVFDEIWEYAQDCLMYMYCRQHNLSSNWRSSAVKKKGLYIMDAISPSVFDEGVMCNDRVLHYYVFIPQNMKI